MSSDSSHRLLLIPAVALIIGVCLAALGAGSLAVVSAERDEIDSRLNEEPCGLHGQRLMDRNVIEDRGEITVTANYAYQCPTMTKRINVFVMVENSRELDRSGYGSREYIPNLQDGLNDFVDEIDFDGGSKAGFMYFSNRYSTRVELSDGPDGKQQVKSAIRTIKPGAGSTANAFGEAVQEAVTLLQADENWDDAVNAILFVQAGARVNNPSVDWEPACKVAKDAGVTITGLALEGVEDTFLNCASEGWFRTGARSNGEDLPRILKGLGTSLVSGHKASFVEYCDGIAQDFEFVEGSGSPRPPDSTALDTYCWQDEPPMPTGGYSVTYRIRAKPDVANDIAPTSLDLVLRLTFEDSSWTEQFLDVPDVCVHLPGQVDFCDRFATAVATPAPTATLPPPTVPPTDTPTASPTSDEPTTPAPTETATRRPGDVTIFMPLVLKAYVFE